MLVCQWLEHIHLKLCGLDMCSLRLLTGTRQLTYDLEQCRDGKKKESNKKCRSSSMLIFPSIWNVDIYECRMVLAQVVCCHNVQYSLHDTRYWPKDFFVRCFGTHGCKSCVVKTRARNESSGWLKRGTNSVQWPVWQCKRCGTWARMVEKLSWLDQTLYRKAAWILVRRQQIQFEQISVFVPLSTQPQQVMITFAIGCSHLLLSISYVLYIHIKGGHV